MRYYTVKERLCSFAFALVCLVCGWAIVAWFFRELLELTGN